MRTEQIVVAMVQDMQGRFLVTYNEKWSGYAFPMQDFDSQSQVMERVAVEALESDLKIRLPHATAIELEYLGRFGRSGRSAEETWYDYWLYEIDPGQPLDLAAPVTLESNPPLFLDPSALLGAKNVTWSTSAISREFLENQDAVLAIVTRPNDSETEYLVVRNDNYGGYFFPTTRIKSEHKPEQIAVKMVRADLGYRGPVMAQWRGEAIDVHFSGRLLRNRLFRFHICQIEMPEVDLQQSPNPLESALTARGKRWRWMTADQLADPATRFSPTMAAVRPTVVAVISP